MSVPKVPSLKPPNGKSEIRMTNLKMRFLTSLGMTLPNLSLRGEAEAISPISDFACLPQAGASDLEFPRL
jgi:hypothetical protein